MSQVLSKNHFQAAQSMICTLDAARYPEDSGKEVAFAGRSNAGKSSLLNMLVQQKNLAQTSKQPGRTKGLHFFQLMRSYRLVDLPGYGFAQVSRQLKQRWQTVLNDYFHTRKSLAAVVVIMDIRCPCTELDQQLCQWATQAELPVYLVLTKSDKLKRAEANRQYLSVQKTIASWGLEAEIQLFSASKAIGVSFLKKQVIQWLTA